MESKLVKIAVVAVAGLMISSCGVKSSPQAPGGSTFPAQYPAPLPPLNKTAQEPGASDSPAPVVSDPKSFWQYPNTPPAN